MELPSTIAECHELILKQQALNEELMPKIIAMEALIKELESPLSQNSPNRHRLPSSDGYRKKPVLARKPTGSQGGKRGHNGKTLKMLATADSQEPLYPKRSSFGTSLKGEGMILQARRQIFDWGHPQKKGLDKIKSPLNDMQL
jgi:transposase